MRLRGQWDFRTFYEGSGQPVAVSFDGEVVDASSYDGQQSLFGLGQFTLTSGEVLTRKNRVLVTSDGKRITMPSPPPV